MAKSSMITATQAMKQLGVKKETLYAYVSRGLIRVAGKSKKRESLYFSADIKALEERSLARHGKVPAGSAALKWGSPVLESAITNILPGGPAYRGYSVGDLFEMGLRYENIAELLWSGILIKEKIAWDFTAKRELTLGHSKGLPPSLLVARLLSHELSNLAFEDADASYGSADAMTGRARKIMTRLATVMNILSAKKYPTKRAQGLAETLVVAMAGKVDKAATRLVNDCLILCADHELTASTFAARIAASTDSDLYACLQAGLGVLAGPKHGTTFTKLEKAVAALAKNQPLEDELENAIDESFRHTLYASGDPRAKLLFERMEHHQISNAYTEKLLAKLRQRTLESGGHPTIDLPLVIAANAMGLPQGAAAAIFMIGRIAGLVAHILEQRASGFMVRPRAKYVGR